MKRINKIQDSRNQTETSLSLSSIDFASNSSFPIHHIDFVLVYNSWQKEEESSNRRKVKEHATNRKIFLDNLKAAGLKINKV